MSREADSDPVAHDRAVIAYERRLAQCSDRGGPLPLYVLAGVAALFLGGHLPWFAAAPAAAVLGAVVEIAARFIRRLERQELLALRHRAYGPSEIGSGPKR